MWKEIYFILKWQISKFSKLKDSFKFDENSGKFSKKAKNSAGKGEITCYEQFLLFPRCFGKTCTADM